MKAIPRRSDATPSALFDPREEDTSAFYASWLAERLPGMTLVRAWCGATEQERWDELETLRMETGRLRAMVEWAISILRSARHPNYARDLEKAYLGDEYEDRSKDRARTEVAWRKEFDRLGLGIGSDPPADRQNE